MLQIENTPNEGFYIPNRECLWDTGHFYFNEIHPLPFIFCFKDQSKNLLELDGNQSFTELWTYYKAPELWALKCFFTWWSLCYVNCIPIGKKTNLKNKAVPTGESEAKTAAPSSWGKPGEGGGESEEEAGLEASEDCSVSPTKQGAFRLPDSQDAESALDPAVLCRAEDPASQRGCGAKDPAPNTTNYPTSLPSGPSASFPGRYRPKHQDSQVIRAVAVGFVQGTENHHVCCRLNKVATWENWLEKGNKEK